MIIGNTIICSAHTARKMAEELMWCPACEDMRRQQVEDDSYEDGFGLVTNFEVTGCCAECGTEMMDQERCPICIEPLEDCICEDRKDD